MNSHSFDLDLARAVPPVPEHFLRAMRDALGGLERARAVRRRKALTAAAVALAAMLALAGCAAARSGILRQIFTRSEPDRQAEAMVRPVNRTVDGELLSFTVDEYVLDGEDLYVRWTAHMPTDESLLLRGSGMQTAFSGDVFLDQDEPGGLGWTCLSTENAADGALTGMNRGHFYEEAGGEPFDVTFQLALIRPDANARVVQALQPCALAAQPVWVGDGEGGYIPTYGYFARQTESDGWEMSYGSPDGAPDPWQDWQDARREAVGAYQAFLDSLPVFGFGEVVETLSLSFTVDPQADSGVRLAAPIAFEREGYTLTVTRAAFTGVNAAVDAEIAWHGPQDGLSFQLWIDGRDTGLAAMLDSSGDTSALSFWSEGGTTARPSAVTLVPGRYETANGSRAFLPNLKDAMEIPLQ